jgi:hypothetical protein
MDKLGAYLINYFLLATEFENITLSTTGKNMRKYVKNAF